MSDISFIDILKKFITEQGFSIFENQTKCNGLLKDYASGNFKREIRILQLAFEAGAYKEIYINQLIQILE